MPCQSLRTSSVFLEFAINSFLSRTILVSNSVPLRFLPTLFLLSRLRLVFVSISSMSSLQYRRYTLIRLLPPLLLSRLHLRTRLDIHVNVFLQNRRYTLIRLLPLCLSRLHPSICPDIYVNVLFTISSMHSSIPLVSLVFYVRFLSHSVGNFQLLFPSPSPMYPRTPPSIFNTSRFPPGALSFYSPFSMSPLMSLRPLRRRMRDRRRQFLLFQVRLFAFSPFRPSSLCNCSTRTSNPCCQCNSILFLHRLSVSSSLFPPSLRPLADVLTFTYR